MNDISNLLREMTEKISAIRNLEDILTCEEVCKLLKISRCTLYRKRKQGLIKFFKISKAKSGSVRFYRSDIMSYLDSLKMEELS